MPIEASYQDRQTVLARHRLIIGLAGQRAGHIAVEARHGLASQNLGAFDDWYRAVGKANQLYGAGAHMNGEPLDSPLGWLVAAHQVAEDIVHANTDTLAKVVAELAKRRNDEGRAGIAFADVDALLTNVTTPAMPAVTAEGPYDRDAMGRPRTF